MSKKNITFLLNCKAQSFRRTVTLSTSSPPEQALKPSSVVCGCLCIYFWHAQNSWWSYLFDSLFWIWSYDNYLLRYEFYQLGILWAEDSTEKCKRVWPSWVWYWRRILTARRNRKWKLACCGEAEERRKIETLKKMRRYCKFRKEIIRSFHKPFGSYLLNNCLCV